MAAVNRRQAILSGIGVALLAPRHARAQFSTRLSRNTDAAFDAYVANAESTMEWRAHLQPSPAGTVAFVPGNGKSPTDVKDGLIHDWMVAAVAPGARVENVLAVLQDYPAYKIRYAPNVTDSRVLWMSGGSWRVYLRLYKKQVLTADLSTEYEIRYTQLGEGRWNMTSHSTKVAENDDGKELPSGTGHGFLWRLNAYWLLEQRREGVYMECRAISLSRDVPLGLGWVIKPMITSVPRETLLETIDSTIRALR